MKYFKISIALIIAIFLMFLVKNHSTYKLGQQFCVQNVALDGSVHFFQAQVYHSFRYNKENVYVVGPKIDEGVPPIEYLAIIKVQHIKYWLDTAGEICALKSN